MTQTAQRSSSSVARINALDVGRGVAILSVIYGHALSPWFMSAGDSFSEAAFLQWKFGASFMMVFFFFLSGVGWREDKALSTTTRQALALLFIAILASAAYDFVRLVAGLTGVANLIGTQPMSISTFIDNLVRMVFVGDYYSLSSLWFLAALAWVRILATLTARISWKVSWAAALLLTAVALTSTAFAWINVHQSCLLGVAFLAFLAGHAARGLWSTLERRASAAYGLTLLGCIATALTFHLNDGCRWDVFGQCGLDWLGGRFGVSMFMGQFGNLAMFMLTAVTGIAFASGLSMLLARLGGWLGQRLEAWGRNSLNLLVVNTLFLHVVNVFVARLLVPRVEADGVVFFVALFVLTLVANLIAAELLQRPTRKLYAISRSIAGRLVGAGSSLTQWTIESSRGLRVSQSND